MFNPIRRSTPLFVALIVLFSSGVLEPAAAQEDSEPPTDSTTPFFATGAAARDRLDQDDPAVALVEFDSTVAVDVNGEVLYLDPPAPGGQRAGGVERDGAEHAAATAENAVDEDQDGGDGTNVGDRATPPTPPEFELASLPGAHKTILLDFDGHVTTGTSWNAAVGTDSIVTGPYDLDGDQRKWSRAELQVVRDTWAVVAEDFAPWDVNITTVEPIDPGDLTKDGDGDVRWGTRVVVTPDDWSGCRCGAMAYLGSFDDVSDEPVFVHNTDFRGVSEAASHTVGHALGLLHDGGTTGGEEARLYEGHDGLGGPDWAPIMGSGFGRAIGQWSTQEYWGADNIDQDDLEVISSLTNGNGFGRRPDDHGGPSDPTPLNGSTPLVEGIIGTRGDTDAFGFATTGGAISLTVTGAAIGSNLDVGLILLDEEGAVVASDDPAERLSAAIAVEVTSGTYTAVVDGVGVGLPFIDPPAGYNDGASLGRYTLTGSIEGAEPADLDPPPTPSDLIGVEVDGSVVLGWSPTDADELDRYVIGRSAVSGGPYHDEATTRRDRNGHEDPTPPAGIGHYVVVAVDAVGNRSEPSNEVVIEVAPPVDQDPEPRPDDNADPALEDRPEPDETDADATDHEPTSDEAPERETFVYGSVVGGVAAIAEPDGDGVRITETRSGGAERARHDRLDHRWSIPAADGNQELWVVAEVERDAGDADEGFVIDWSTDRIDWTTLVTILPGEAIDETFDIGAPEEVVHVRVVDTDRTPRQQRPDSVFVDLLRVIGDGRPVEPLPEPTEVGADIRYHYQGRGEGERAIVVTASVQDDQGEAVAGAVVEVVVDGDIVETVTVTTGSKGAGVVQTDAATLRPEVEVCVTNVQADGLVWQPGPDDCPGSTTAEQTETEPDTETETATKREDDQPTDAEAGAEDDEPTDHALEADPAPTPDPLPEPESETESEPEPALPDAEDPIEPAADGETSEVDRPSSMIR